MTAPTETSGAIPAGETGLPPGVTAKTVYVAQDGSEHSRIGLAVEKNEDIARTERANALLESGASVWDAAKVWSPFPHSQPPEVLKRINKDTPLIISHWQGRDNPGYTVGRFEADLYNIYVGGDVGAWSGPYGSKISILDLARHVEVTLAKHPELATPEA